jgi:hypothetical protein
MNKRLVFVHGRAQQKKDAGRLKAQWVAAWQKGLGKSGLRVPLDKDQIAFPYYGQTLHDIVKGVKREEVAEIIVRGAGNGDASARFLEKVLRNVLKKHRVTDAQIAALGGSAVIERGMQNKKWVLAMLRAVDHYLPYASGASIAVVTNDVYRYMRDPGLRDTIEEGVRAAFTADLPMVVVGHSLGSVVCYNLLRREGQQQGWKVPQFVTVGSPLGITMIAESLAPIRSPECVTSWTNALDQSDMVALYPLDSRHFKVRPPIENLKHVNNTTPNRHGIAGYLEDKIVARRIYDAVMA